MSRIDSFSDFKLNKQLLLAVSEMGFNKPSPIQQKAIPLILAGHDLLGIAQTGTGKTAAFVLPLLMKIKYAQGSNPRALIIAPSRELAMQIDQHIADLAKYCDIRHLVVYGGKGTKEQIESLREGVDILTATPGRLLDLYSLGEINFKQINTLILDEADKMMDMGFTPQVKRILEVIPRKRQNLLFSATMPERVAQFSDEFLEFPERVEIAPQAPTVKSVSQTVYKVPNLKTKINLLHHLLQEENTFSKVIIFVKTKATANSLFRFLSRKASGEVRVIHGNKDQNARLNAMQAFREEDVRLLVATDVASRGIDISDVSHVINFEVPVVYEDYIHRIGRTGRADKLGEAITMVNPAEEFHLSQVEKIIKLKIKVKPIPAAVEVPDTDFQESQDMARIIDAQKMKADPTYKGAFHEKKDRRASTKDSKYVKGKPKNIFKKRKK